jgi:hypothetical protein
MGSAIHTTGEEPEYRALMYSIENIVEPMSMIISLLKSLAGAGIRSCAHWLNWKCSIAMSVAREKVRAARVLEGAPY